MLIDSITMNQKQLTYTREFDAVFVSTNDMISTSSLNKMRVYYHGEPIKAKRAPWDGGFVWTKDSSNLDWLGVACEGTGASLWWPNKDHLSDEPDSMKVTCTYPSNLDFIGNGRKTGETIHGNLKTTTWSTSYPINNYNVTLNIGSYSHFSDTYTSQIDGRVLELDYYVLPQNLQRAKVQFKQVKPMLEVYEKYLGPYPFWNDGYALVETPYLGMEHQGAIAYGNKYLNGYLGRDFSRIGVNFDYIIIHESGHEWWGNAVSAADIADLWLHEGFCTYTESIYVEGMYGLEKASEYINAKKSSVSNKSPIRGVPGVNHEGDGDMYNKGMLFLNTLRHVVKNDSHWFAILKDMSQNTFKNKPTSYEQVVTYFSKMTKKNLRPIFDQYVNYPSIPVLYYRFETKTKFNKIFYFKWKTDSKGFSMPFHYTLNGKKDFEYATDEWRSVSLNIRKVKKLVFDQKNFYIDVKEY